MRWTTRSQVRVRRQTSRRGGCLMARGNSTASNITNYKGKKLLFCSTDPRKEEHRRGTSRKKGDVSEAKRNLTEGHKPK